MFRSIDIQLNFPDEPNWSEVPRDVLFQLIEEYDIEANCATSALLELSERKTTRH